jgi:hypothetical protein
MRRLIAVLSLFSLANLAFVQANRDCPLSGGSRHVPWAGASHSGHAAHGGHLANPPADQGSFQSMPDGDVPKAPVCLTMGPCALTMNVSAIHVTSVPAWHPGRVELVSDHVPASLTLVPEPPPPRA